MKKPEQKKLFKLIDEVRRLQKQVFEVRKVKTHEHDNAADLLSKEIELDTELSKHRYELGDM